MVRTQLQLDDDTHEALRQSAHRQRKSMSAVARSILHKQLVEDETKPVLTEEFSFIGSGSSGKSDISVRHDDYLAEDTATEPSDKAAALKRLKKKYPWIGMGKSGETDVSVRHDDYLAEDFLDLP